MSCPPIRPLLLQQSPSDWFAKAPSTPSPAPSTTDACTQVHCKVVFFWYVSRPERKIWYCFYTFPARLVYFHPRPSLISFFFYYYNDNELAYHSFFFCNDELAYRIALFLWLLRFADIIAHTVISVVLIMLKLLPHQPDPFVCDVLAVSDCS